MEQCDLILVAGGAGSRYGTDTPKQFQPLLGRPLFLWSLDVFLSWKSIGQVVVVVPQDWVESVISSFKILPNNEIIKVVSGGPSRQASALNGLEALVSGARSNWVMIHDAARPALTPELLERLWSARQLKISTLNFGGVVPGVNVNETIKTVGESGVVGATLPREKLRIIQTPQLFDLEILLESYRDEQSLNTPSIAPDDASVVEKHGFKIVVVLGDYDNVKITFLEDHDRVSSWLRQRHPSF